MYFYVQCTNTVPAFFLHTYVPVSVDVHLKMQTGMYDEVENCYDEYGRKHVIKVKTPTLGTRFIWADM